MKVIWVLVTLAILSPLTIAQTSKVNQWELLYNTFDDDGHILASYFYRPQSVMNSAKGVYVFWIRDLSNQKGEAKDFEMLFKLTECAANQWSTARINYIHDGGSVKSEETPIVFEPLPPAVRKKICGK
jgi:hypothetical protein